MIRDRKMYVAPTPFALARGIERQVTLIDLESHSHSDALERVGSLERIEAEQMVSAYRFDLSRNEIAAEFTPNLNANAAHRFTAYRSTGQPGSAVSLSASI